MSEKSKRRLRQLNSSKDNSMQKMNGLRKNAWRVQWQHHWCPYVLGCNLCSCAIKRKKSYCGCWRKNRPYRTDYFRLNRKRSAIWKHFGRYFVNTYITLREGYNYPSLQYDYETVQLYSSNTVKDDYLRLYNSDMALIKFIIITVLTLRFEVISNIISTQPRQINWPLCVLKKRRETSRPDRFQFHTGRLV